MCTQLIYMPTRPGSLVSTLGSIWGTWSSIQAMQHRLLGCDLHFGYKKKGMGIECNGILANGMFRGLSDIHFLLALR